MSFEPGDQLCALMPFQHKHHMILCYHETDSGDYIQAKIKTYISVLFLMLLFFEKLTFYLFFLFLLYNTVLVLPYIDMNPPQVYMSSHP